MSTSVKVANIIVNPGVVVSHPDPMNTVIIEGKARLATRLRGKLRPLFKEKYDWELDESPDYDAILAITPTKLMAWGKHGEGRWSGRRLREVKRFE